MSSAVLYDYWRSSASYRVRIALNLCGIEFEAVPVDLVKGDQSAPDHIARNPQGFVPVLELDGERFTQSLAIIEYLQETRGYPFLPERSVERARVRALAHAIAMEIHPVCNTSVAAHLVAVASVGGEAAETLRREWMQHFIAKGLRAFEGLLNQPDTADFCHGNTPGMADICLVPQVYNAKRWGADISGLDRLNAIAKRCEKLPAFAAAHPDEFKPAG